MARIDSRENHTEMNAIVLDFLLCHIRRKKDMLQLNYVPFMFKSVFTVFSPGLTGSIIWPTK